MKKIEIQPTVETLRKKIYSRISGRPVFFIKNMGLMGNYPCQYAYSDGEVLVDPCGNGTIKDVYCIMMDGSEVSISELYKAHQTLYKYSPLGVNAFTPFAFYLDCFCMNKTNVEEFGYDLTTITELKSIMQDELIRKFNDVFNKAPKRQFRIKFGQGDCIESIEQYIGDMNDAYLENGAKIPCDGIWTNGAIPYVTELKVNISGVKAYTDNWSNNIHVLCSDILPFIPSCLLEKEAIPKWQSMNNAQVWMCYIFEKACPDYKFVFWDNLLIANPNEY